MNIQQAKRIKLIDIMSFLGQTPLKKERGGIELKYLSPFHAEENPSFNLNIQLNAFFDFSMGEGGNVVDFAILYLKTNGKSARVADALSWLSQIEGGDLLVSQDRLLQKSFSFSQQGSFDNTHLVEEEKQLVFVKAMKLTSKRILDYLEKERFIPVHLAQKYLSTIQYQNLKKPRLDNKPYFAFGMTNRSKGWEIRSVSDTHSFKSALIKRDISIIKGAGDSETIHVFEGMLDFLSALVLQNETSFECDTIIMHSTSSFSRTCEYLQENQFTSIKTWLDNDKTGMKFTSKFIEAFGTKIQPMNRTYAPHKDVNKYLQSLHGTPSHILATSIS
ncbi:MAG TPA: toprim domain-containing protein [Saprospiraceae bacterium]|nr:toprim domain-containing protein [Saprospiraceae bacterium]